MRGRLGRKRFQLLGATILSTLGVSTTLSASFEVTSLVPAASAYRDVSPQQRTPWTCA